MLLARHETTEAMEIFDERGVPLGRVTLPIDPRLFGHDMGTVYLRRQPPAARQTGRGPAQAA